VLNPREVNECEGLMDFRAELSFPPIEDVDFDEALLLEVGGSFEDVQSCGRFSQISKSGSGVVRNLSVSLLQRPSKSSSVLQ